MIGKRISRRTVLRGLGVSVALPWLDAMAPAISSVAGAATTAAKAAAPTRMGFFFLPNGMWMPNFTPAAVGALTELPASLAAFKAIKDDMLVMSGLTLDGAFAHGDGGGDHARSAAAYLTGAHPVKTAGKDIKAGVSVDQAAAEKIGGRTRMPSLELGLDKGTLAGNCDSGYSCAYVNNISWRSDNTPMPKEVDPGAVFDRLFGSEQERQKLRYRQSILDAVADDTASLNRQLGKSDQHKLDEFTTSLREIETRIEKSRQESNGNFKQPDMHRPDGVPGDITEHMKLMCDMMVLAFQMDITRISTFMVARDGSDRLYRNLGVTEGHHTSSHHGRDSKKIDAIQKIDLYHMQQIAYFLEKLKSIKEGDGTLLDHSMIMVGAGIGDGDRHNHDELPVFVAGKANGAITPGRHVRYPRREPLCNLYLSMLDIMGVKQQRFGDSSRLLEGLKA
jgi:hypothetical protein